MKKVFKNSSEVFHIFASQSQDEGRCSNVYFHKNLIYSYGSHFCMANVISPEKVLITTRRYSVTTAKHLSEIRYALNHYERCFVPYPELSFSEDFRSDQSNMNFWANEMQDLYNVIGNKRKKEETRERAKLELKNIVQQIEKYLDWTGQKITASKEKRGDLMRFKTLFEAAKNEESSEVLAAKLADKAIKEIKARQAKQRKNLKLWISGENVDTWSFNAIETVYLRAISNEDGDFIQTSKGAEVTLRAGKILFDLIQSGKDVKGFRIDDRYTVISLNGVLTIGCHKIERKEIERFAKTQNWL